MRIIARRPLAEFGVQHAEVAGALSNWYNIVKRANYRSPHDVRKDFPKASLLGNGLTIFNIGSCRLEVHMRYDLGRVYVRSIDTHDEYERRNRMRKNR